MPKGVLTRTRPFPVQERWKRFAPGVRHGGILRTVFALMFLAVVLGFGACAARTCMRVPVAKLAAQFPAKQKFVEFNGLATRLAGRRMCNRIVKVAGGLLVRGSAARPVERQRDAAVRFARWLEGRGTRYVYCQLPMKIDLETKLCPPGISHTVYASVDEFLAGLVTNGVEVLDLRAALAATPDDVMRNFYRTDHHWNNDAAFTAFKILSARLGAPVDEARWRRSVVPQSLLGSLGRRTGRRFAGRLDDMVLYHPDFETDMSLEIPERKLKVTGTFDQTVMRNAGKIKPNGKYRCRAYSCAYVGEIAGLTRHRNPSAPVKKKILIIGDSFARPLEGLLSTVVSELDVLDPRRYRGPGTVAEYVAGQSPDEVYQILNPLGLFAESMVGPKTGKPAFFEYGLGEGNR